MLKIKHSFIDFPQVTFNVPRPMEFSAVPVDQDELTQDIAYDSVAHDDNWELTERPDGNELALYLESIVSDETSQSDTINFANE